MRLRVASSQAWVQTCLDHPREILSDHAHCERKAAASALSFIVRAPEDGTLVTAMATLAREEAGHLQRVHRLLKKRGWTLLHDRPDPYVQGLRSAISKGRQAQLVDELLVAALIEARSAERLGLLGAAWPDPELGKFYAELAQAEAGHAVLFVERARSHAGTDLDARLQDWLEREAKVMDSLAGEPRMHG